MTELLACLPLTPTSRRLLGTLYEEHIVSRQRISVALYGMRPENKQPDGIDRMIDVHLSILRRRLKAEGIVISVTRAIGWYLKAEDREKVRLWIASCA